MSKEQIEILLQVNAGTAEMLMTNGEKFLYYEMRKQLATLRRDYDVHLNMDQLRFFYYINHPFNHAR